MSHNTDVAKRHFHLNETETQQLQVAYESCKNGPARTRLQAVRLYGSGYKPQEITAITGVDRRLLLRWCAKYRERGLSALYDQRKGGNHRVLTEAQLADVGAKLQQYRPVDVLGEAQVATADGLYWTVADLRQALARWQGVTYKSDTSYCTLLKRCGYSYQRAGKQFRSRSEARLAEFEEQLEKN